ncbi:glycoside hydrolase family 105 protein [Hypoxylon sp. FL1284]|nr:glycoside hydrolase family 105 protein [Hypoxylon sp. FL1284]
MHSYLASALLLAHSAASAAVTSQSRYSSWMAESIMSRGQGIMTGSGGSSELLQAGITQRALTALAAQYPDDDNARFAGYVRDSAASVAPFTLNATYDAFSYPLDRLSTGDALLALAAADSYGSSNSNFSSAVDALRQSIDLNRRNAEGGLWYFVYPEWSYLDGMYSLAPFYTRWALSALRDNRGEDGNDNATVSALEDVGRQLDLLWARTRNATTGLLAHGYDASRTAVWADPVTGASPHVWGRSLGWYAMALVDTLEALPPQQPQTESEFRDGVLRKWQALAPALADAADPATGGWWQVMDAPGAPRNYVESSGSAMFAYALLKGARLGYTAAAAPAAVLAALRAHRYLTDAFVVREANGTLGYNGTVAVCSLNSTATYEYYVGQPINYNSVLGSAAYVLASLEVERLERV